MNRGNECKNPKDVTVKQALSYISYHIEETKRRSSDLNIQTSLALIQHDISLVHESIISNEILEDDSPFMQVERDFTDNETEYITNLINQDNLEQYQAEYIAFAKTKE